MRIERAGDVAVVRMEAPPANAITLQFLEQLSGLFDEARGARAAVLAGLPKFFSGGLDLRVLVDRGRDEMRGFMAHFERVMLQLFELPIPLVAAVEGHAIAGGCVLALQCDVRVLAADPALRIGLNEAQLGLGLPLSVLEPLRLQVPPQSLARLALGGELVAPLEALQLGLVHELGGLDRALERAAQLAKLPAAGALHVKESLRRPIADGIRARSSVEAERWLDTFYHFETQQALRAVVAKLNAPKR